MESLVVIGRFLMCANRVWEVLTGYGNWRYGRMLLIDDYGGYPNWRYTGTDEGASERATLGADAIEGRLKWHSLQMLKLLSQSG